MRRTYDAIVIGTGMGGCACGALLAHAGLRTMILEKNERVGGSCSYYTRDGFHVDIGTHTFSRGNKGPIGVVQRRLGIPNVIPFVQTRDLAVARGMGFDIALPSSAWRLPAFFVRLFHQMRVPFREIPRVAGFFYDISSMPDEEITAWDRRTIEEFIFLYTKNPRVFSYMAFILGLYFVLPAWEISAGEAILCYKRMFRDNALSYPRGGAVAIPLTFLKAAQSHGAKVLTGANVTKIIVEKGVVRGVECDDGRDFEAKAVVSTTSLKDNVFRLVGEKHFPPEYAAKVKGIRGSEIAVQAKIALDRRLIHAGCLVGGASTHYTGKRPEVSIKDMKGMYQDIRRGRIPRIVPLYCPIPTNFDPALGPPGTQLLTVCSVAPTMEVKIKDPPEAWIGSMLDALRTLVPGLDKHILWMDTYTVKDIAGWTGKMFGPAISTGQTPDQVGAMRPSCRTPVKGLYFAGDCAGGRGIGTELAVQSGIECADLIVLDRNWGFVTS